MESAGKNVVAIFASLMTVAVIAVVVSQRAQTSTVIKALGTATTSAIGAAVSPVGSGQQGS